MSSLTHGKNISKVEVTNISQHGIWLLTENKELFLSYEDFPWFQDRKVKEILNIEIPSPDHIYWPDIDVDLTLDIIEHPEKYPLKSK